MKTKSSLLKKVGTGFLVPFAHSILNATQRGFEEMNLALKRIAEQ
jgi:hypothetical protein